MTISPPPVHSYQLARSDGCTLLAFFKRVDLSEIQQIAITSILDASIDPKHLAELICDGLNRELVTRAAETMKGKPNP